MVEEKFMLDWQIGKGGRMEGCIGSANSFRALLHHLTSAFSFFFSFFLFWALRRIYWNAIVCQAIILQQRLEEKDLELRRLNEELSRKELTQEGKDSVADETAFAEEIQVKTEIEV